MVIIFLLLLGSIAFSLNSISGHLRRIAAVNESFMPEPEPEAVVPQHINGG